jgi:uncharacterized repeat protein (TIGR01451 family)
MKGTVACILAVVALLPFIAWGQQQGDIVITSVAEVEVAQKNAQGKTEMKRVDATKARVAPGDVVIFTTRYSNRGKQPAAGVVITNPVPEHMAYVDLSAAGKDTRIDFSIDGGKTYGSPERLAVTDKDGKTRPAMPADYTHIRWTVAGALAPGASGSVTFRARIK